MVKAQSNDILISAGFLSLQLAERGLLGGGKGREKFPKKGYTSPLNQ